MKLINQRLMLIWCNTICATDCCVCPSVRLIASHVLSLTDDESTPPSHVFTTLFFDFVNVTVSKPVSVYVDAELVCSEMHRDGERLLFPAFKCDFHVNSISTNSTEGYCRSCVMFDHSFFIQCCILNCLLNIVQGLRKHCIGSHKSTNSQESLFKTLLKSRQKSLFIRD